MSISLTDTEKLGLRILALIRKGQLNDYDCSTCTEKDQEQRNCVGAIQDPDNLPQRSLPSDPMLGKLYTCPIRLVPMHLWDFLDEYNYYEKYPAKAPSYNDVNPRFWASLKYFESQLNIIDKRDSEGYNKTSQKEQDNMDSMKRLFM